MEEEGDEVVDEIPKSPLFKSNAKPSFGRMFRAIFLKNVTLQSRQRWTLCCQSCLTLSAIVFVGLYGLISTSLPVNPVFTEYSEWLTSPFNEWEFYAFNGPPVAGTFDETDNTIVPGSGLFGSFAWNRNFSVSFPDWMGGFNVSCIVPRFIKAESSSDLEKVFLSALEVVNENCQDPSDWEADKVAVHSGRNGTVEYYTVAPDEDPSIDNDVYQYSLAPSDNCPEGYYVLPMAGFDFVDISGDQDSYSLKYQIIGGDYSSYPNTLLQHRWHPTQFNRMSLVARVHNAFLAHFTSGRKTFNAFLRNMGNSVDSFYPNVDEYAIQYGAIVFSLSLLVPMHLQKVVIEKQNGIMEMNKLMGMKMRHYWIAAYLFDYFLFFLVTTLLTCITLAFKMIIIWTPNVEITFLWIPLFLVWGHSQILLSYFWSSFFSNSNRSTLFGYLIAFFGSIIAIILNVVLFGISKVPPWYLMAYPPFTFSRLAFLVAHTQASPSLMARPEFDVVSQFIFGFIWLFGMSFAYLVVGFYLQQVLPKRFGVRRPLWFPITYLCKPVISLFSSPKKKAFFQLDQLHNADDDNDVTEERHIIIEEQIPENTVLTTFNLGKVYSGFWGKKSTVALSHFYLHVQAGECFGLLGPNGAGKTTLIEILCGLLHPSCGTAKIGEFDIIHQFDKIRGRIGMCPQFDVLWDDLNVLEHLLFYARLKGIPRKQEKGHVEAIVRQAGLEGDRRRLGKDLSGGMKRRLSVGIALTGNPLLVFLDEPTTGLDPSSKRGLWDLILEARTNHTLVLTTHSMEEADVLCSRIGIVCSGSLKALGPQSRLKSKLGKGFKIELTYDVSAKKLAHSFIKNLLPSAIMLREEVGSCVFQMPRDTKLSQVFEQMETNKSRYGIKHCAFSQTSLEDVFLDIVERDLDAEEEDED